MARRPWAAVLFLVFASFLASQVMAEDLADVIPAFFSAGIELDPGNTIHDAHFKDPTAAAKFGQLNAAIAAQFSSYPLGSTSGGLTYTFDPSLGAPRRNSDTFGPIFAERASTIGKGTFNLGVAYLHQDFDSFDGLELGNGEIVVPMTHEDVDPSDPESPSNPPTPYNPYYEGDIIDTQLRMSLTLDTTLLYGNYGLNDRFDVGIAIPFVQADLDGIVRAHIERLSTGPTSTTHQFEGGSLDRDFALSGKESGIGDVVLRGKYALLNRPKTKTGIAVALDVRLPTGDEDNLLGTGATRFRAFGAASTAWARIYPHANLGYTFSGSGRFDLPDELDYTLGLDAALHPKFTVAVDLLGRTLFDARSVSSTDRTLTFNTNPATTPPILDSVVRPDLNMETDDVSLLHGALGLKFNPGGNALVTASVLTALSDHGLADDLAFSVGFEWSF